MENSRRKQFISFKLHAVLSIVVKSRASRSIQPGTWITLCPVSPPCRHSPPVGHLVAVSVMRSVMSEREREHIHITWLQYIAIIVLFLSLVSYCVYKLNFLRGMYIQEKTVYLGFVRYCLWVLTSTGVLECVSLK